jgi:hypothetical protein
METNRMEALRDGLFVIAIMLRRTAATATRISRAPDGARMA